jgi:uncharacterized protein YndB with AHSA1/START domain
MFKTIALVLVLVILAILAYAATRPNEFRVERSTTINAPPERIYALIENFHQWGAWSPWEKLDPALQRTFSGPESGKGAGYAWVGNKKVGSGSMEILEATPPSRVNIRLDFLKPFEAHNLTDFELEPRGNATHVTWSTHGPSPYVTKLMGVFVSMDQLIGKDFEQGLANLKTAAEQGTGS